MVRVRRRAAARQLTFSGRIATVTAALEEGWRGAATAMASLSRVVNHQATMLLHDDVALEQIDVADEAGDPARGGAS